MEAVKAAEQGEVPVGAVVVCRDRIIGRGHNLTETLNDVTAHAEMQAVTAAANTLGGKYLNECTLYVTVEPCVMCAGAIAWAQTGKLVFGAEDPKRGYQKYAPDALSLIHMLPNIVKPIKTISRKIISRKPKNPNIVISFFIYHVQQACHVYCLRSFFS